MFRVNGKHFAWAWLERIDPKKARLENRGVLAVRVAGDIEKQMLLAMDKDAFFTEPHYDGYNAVLVRLARIDRPRLKELIIDAYELSRETTTRPRAATKRVGTARSGSRSGPRSRPGAHRAR
jgi:hypothetical protein